MKAEIITINSQVLRGQTLNMNVAFLTRELTSLGIPVQQSVMLHNDSNNLKYAVQSAEKRADLIILTGDLGPDKEMILMGSHPLENSTGLPAGFYYTHNETTYIVLPESFEELKPMFIEKTRPLIIEKLLNNRIVETQIYSLYGLTLSQINEKLHDLLTYDGNPFVGIYFEDDEVEIQITAQAQSEKEVRRMMNKVRGQIKNRLGEYIIDEQGLHLASVVKNLLKEQNKKITAAESLTSGAFLSLISGEPEASEIFEGGIVTYSNHIKNNVLQVNQETIDKYGVVSSQCAIEMAKNSLEMFDADLSVSLTGVAGPSSLEGEIPGTVWIGLAQKEQETFAKKFHFGYTRERNRQNAVLSALNLVRLTLLEKPIEGQIFLDE